MISNFELVYCLYRSFGEQCNPCVLIVLMFPVCISFLVGLETPVSIGICKKLDMVNSSDYLLPMASTGYIVIKGANGHFQPLFLLNFFSTVRHQSTS